MEWLAPIPLTPLEDSEWSPLNFCQLDRIPDIPKSEKNSHLQLDKWSHLDISIGDSVLILHNFTTHQPHPTFPKRSLKYSFGYCRWITNQQKSTENNEIQRFPQLVSNPAGESSRPVTCSRRGAAWASRKPWWIHGFRFMDNRLILCLRTQWIRLRFGVVEFFFPPSLNFYRRLKTLLLKVGGWSIPFYWTPQPQSCEDEETPFPNGRYGLVLWRDAGDAEDSGVS